MKATLIATWVFALTCWLLSCKNLEPSETTTPSETTSSTKKSISNTLKENEQLPIADRVALYLRLKKEQPNAYNFDNEDELTMYGYGLLWADKPEEALGIFQLIARQFPESANAYDSLGEAYLVLGQKERALEHYRQSLAMNPDNFNAEDAIERILHPEIKPLTPEERFSQVFTVDDYRSDLRQLGEKLLEVHPNALKFTSQTAFWNTLENLQQQVTPETTYAEFTWMCSKVIAQLGCSHTSNGHFFPQWEMLPLAQVFPLEVRWMDGKLYVTDASVNSETISKRDVITTINGKPVTELIESIYAYIPAQAHVRTYKTHQLNDWLMGMLPYAMGLPKEFTVTTHKHPTPILLKPLEKGPEWQPFPFRRKCQDNLCLELREEEKTAILTIASFNYYPWNNLDAFETFVDESFARLQEAQIENLILDVRFNGGGSAESSIHLLKYLLKAPFSYFTQNEETYTPFENRFRGNLYTLIDGRGNSTTGHFMAKIKEAERGVIIGEELGSNKLCTAGQSVLRLKHTKMVYYVANTASEVWAPSLPDDRGILPDHEVVQSVADYFNQTDTVMEFALALPTKK